MINRTLHALSNRSTFTDPLFSPDPDFIPAKFNLGTASVYHALLLDVATTDYYLRNYLGVLAAYPDLQSQFFDDNTSYQMTDFIPRGVKISGAELLSTSSKGGFFTDPANTALPLALTYWIDYQDNSSCKITAVETGATWLTDCAAINNNGTLLLTIDWPAGVPFSGILVLSQLWLPEARVIIEVLPSQFPYAALMTQVRAVPYLSRLLTDFSLTAAFANSFEVTEQLAIVLTAFGLSNPAIMVGQVL